jgi:hypothetical protein
MSQVTTQVPTPRALAPDLARLLLLFIGLACASSTATAQQFNSDSYWVAPRGVVTSTLTAGEEYSMAIATAALLQDWEFNLGVTRFAGDRSGSTDEHYSGILYAKYRFTENEQANGGFAIMAGTGVNPGHLEAGVVTDTFKSWWATGAYTIPFRDGDISLDLMPGFVWNKDQDDTDVDAWGFTWSARLAVYKVVPNWTIVGEAFGTTGEARADPQYKVGLRWESPKLVVAATYGAEFDGSTGSGFEVGFSYFSDPLLGP